MLVAAGVAYGIHKGLSPKPSAPACDPRVDELRARLQKLEAAVQQIPSPGVSSQEVAEAIDRATARLECDLDRRFAVQSLSIASLRSLITQTDRLLERVLGHLEDAAEESGDADEWRQALSHTS